MCKGCLLESNLLLTNVFEKSKYILQKRLLCPFTENFPILKLDTCTKE